MPGLPFPLVVARCSPWESECQKRWMVHPRHSIHYFLGISLSAFTVVLSLSFLACLRLSETDHNYYYTQGLFPASQRPSLISAFNLLPGLKQTVDWCCCFLLCPMPVTLWESWSSNAAGQLQAGTDSEKQFPVPLEQLGECEHPGTLIHTFLLQFWRPPSPCLALLLLPPDVESAWLEWQGDSLVGCWGSFWGADGMCEYREISLWCTCMTAGSETDWWEMRCGRGHCAL